MNQLEEKVGAIAVLISKKILELALKKETSPEEVSQFIHQQLLDIAYWSARQGLIEIVDLEEDVLTTFYRGFNNSCDQQRTQLKDKGFDTERLEK